MEQGIYKLSDADYHADPCDEPSLSASLCKTVWGGTMAQAWQRHPRLNPDFQHFESSTFDLGTTAHQLLLGGDTKVCVINPEDYRSKPTKSDPEGSVPKGWTNNAIRDARDEARKNGLVPILPWDYANTKKMHDAAIKFISESEIYEDWYNCETEVTYIAQDGIWLRSKMDIVRNDRKRIIDYKTTGISAKPEQFLRHAVSTGYDIQAAFYQYINKLLTGEKADFVFLVQEDFAPFQCSLVGVTQDMIDDALAKVHHCIYKFELALRCGKWPSYGGGITWMDMPEYEKLKVQEFMYQQEIDNA